MSHPGDGEGAIGLEWVAECPIWCIEVFFARLFIKDLAHSLMLVMRRDGLSLLNSALRGCGQSSIAGYMDVAGARCCEANLYLPMTTLCRTDRQHASRTPNISIWNLLL